MKTLLTTALLGLRHRWQLTIASVVLVLLAEAAAVLAPLYAGEAVDSYLVTKLRATTPFLTGVTLDYHPVGGAQTRQAAEEAAAPFTGLDVSRFEPPRVSFWADRVRVSAWSNGMQTIGSLTAEPGLCRRLVLVSGRCPHRAGEAIIFRPDANRERTVLGSRLRLGPGVPPLTVVGTYRSPRNSDAYDPSRMVSSPPQVTSRVLTYSPAPFVVLPSTLDGSTLPWVVRTDYALRVPASTTSSGLRDAKRQARHVVVTAHAHRGPGSYEVALGSALRAIIAEVEQRRAAAWRTILPAVASLVVVALVLLLRLFKASFDGRRPELGLARLRGLQGPRLWLFAMSEPTFVVAAGVPAGVAAGYAANSLLARAWFVPGLPAAFAPSSVAIAGAVAVAGLVLAAVCVWGSTRQTLLTQLGDAPGPSRTRRVGWLGRFILVALTIGVVGAGVISRSHSVGLGDLLLPVLLAATLGVCLTSLTTSSATWYAVAAPGARLPLYIASRAVARRRDATGATLPLAACVAIAIFAGAVYSSAAAWRASAAATEAGADLSYVVDLPMPAAVTLTRRVDPAGRWVMAAGTTLGSSPPFIVVDSSRMARVMAWPTSWTPGRTAADVARAIGPVVPPLLLTGRALSMTVTSDLPRGERDVIDVELRTANGTPDHFFLWPVTRGRSVLRDTVDRCSQTCEVTGLAVTASNAPTLGAKGGSLTISDVTLDGHALPRLAEIGWRPVEGQDSVVATCVLHSEPPKGCVRLELPRGGGDANATFEPADVPPVVPVLVGRRVRPAAEAPTGSVFTIESLAGFPTRLRSVGRTESTPFRGPGALLADYTSFGRRLPLDLLTDVHVLARADTPPRILQRITDAGATSSTTLTGVRRTLDDEPLALALNLYLITAGLALALAVAALCAHFGVQLHSRRRDSASLRVIGVGRRVLFGAAMVEILWSIGGAVLAGCVAGVVAQALTARGLTLGYADVLATPRVTTAIDTNVVLVAGLAVLAAMLAVSALIAALTIRSAHAATIREN